MKTITAISTPLGSGGIGIVRVSGDNALNIVKKVFKPLKNTKFESYKMKLGFIYDNEEKIDEVLVSYFKAPNSYTGEDVCEINCHGGLVVTKKILEIFLKNGAQMAGPGEFTKRAFLNGKLDLSQAEAVIDTINSKTLKEEKAAIKQLDGILGDKIREIKGTLVGILVDIEANIDYPEYDIEEVKKERINKVISSSIEELSKLEDTFESGKILKEGIETVIIGKPNVGKSSLMNNLLNKERAIVTDIAGTTRDTIEESILVEGIPLKIVDTAGIRESEDLVEKIGIEKSKKAIENAQLVLFLLDASTEISAEDEELLRLIDDKNKIILLNKIDIKLTNIEEKFKKIGIEKYIEISIKNNIGIDSLKEEIAKMFELDKIEADDSIVITNARHKRLITLAKEELSLAKGDFENGVPIDMLSLSIQKATQELGEIIGESVSDDIIKGIFAKFCVGK